MEQEQLRSILLDHGIRPTAQRLRILSYLEHVKVHPTAAVIFHEIQKHHQHIARMTVYNTLSLFAEKGLLKPLSIEEGELRYDIEVHLHGHFLCESCGKITNFELTSDLAIKKDLAGYQIRDKQVIYKGICSQCQTLNIR